MVDEILEDAILQGYKAKADVKSRTELLSHVSHMSHTHMGSDQNPTGGRMGPRLLFISYVPYRRVTVLTNKHRMQSNEDDSPTADPGRDDAYDQNQDAETLSEDDFNESEDDDGFSTDGEDEPVVYYDAVSHDPFQGLSGIDAPEELEREMFRGSRDRVGESGAAEENGESEEEDTMGPGLQVLEDIVQEAKSSQFHLQSRTLEVAYSQKVTSEIFKDAYDCWPMIGHAIKTNNRIQESLTSSLAGGASSHVELTVAPDGIIHARGPTGSLRRSLLDLIVVSGNYIVKKVCDKKSLARTSVLLLTNLHG